MLAEGIAPCFAPNYRPMSLLFALDAAGLGPTDTRDRLTGETSDSISVSQEASVKVHEYQAKELLAKYGVPVPPVA